MSRPRLPADVDALLARDDLGLPPALWNAFDGRDDLRRALATACRLAWSEEQWAARQGEELARALAADEPGVRRALFAPLSAGAHVALTDGPRIPLALLVRLLGEAAGRGDDPWPTDVRSVAVEGACATALPPLPAALRQLAIRDAPELDPGAAAGAPFLPALTSLVVERSPAAEPWKVASIGGHTGFVRSVGWDPDGTTLASAGDDGRLILWREVEDGWRTLASLEGHGRPIARLAWDPRGGRVATASADHTVRLWGESAGRWSQLARLEHPAEVTGVEWSPDGTRLLTVADDPFVRVWNPTPDGWRSTELVGHGGLVQCARWSPDGVRIASGGGDATVRVWTDEGARFTESVVVREHGDWVRTVDWSSDGARLASGSDDGTAAIVPITSGWLDRLRRPHAPHVKSRPKSRGKHRTGGTLTEHEGWVRRVAFSPCGAHLATASDDGGLRLYPADAEPEECAPRATYLHAARVSALGWSPSGAHLATGADDGVLRIFPATGDCAPVEGTAHGETIGCLEWQRGRPVLVTGGDDRTVRVWRPAARGLGGAWRALLERGGSPPGAEPAR